MFILYSRAVFWQTLPMEILSSGYWKSSLCDNSIVYSIYFRVKYTDLTKFSVCRFFTSFLLISISLFFSPLTFSFLSLLRNDPFTKTLLVFGLTPYLVQSPDASELMEFSLLQACWKNPPTWLGYRASQHVFDKEDAWTLEVYSTVHGNSLFTSKPQFPGPRKSCGTVTSHGFVFSTSIIHMGVKHYL